MKKSRKLLAVVLALVMMLSMIPAANAAGAVSLYTGQSTTLSTTLVNSPLVYGISWTSSDSSVVSVTPSTAGAAIVTAVAPGTATITALPAYFGSDIYAISDSWTVTVTAPAAGTPGSYVSMSGSLSLGVGDTGSLTLTAATGVILQSVSWSTSNPAVAAVSGGNSVFSSVAACGSGVATVTASVTGTYNGTPFFDSATCTVSVTGTGAGAGSGIGGITGTANLALSNSSAILAVGGTTTLTATSASYGVNYVEWSSSNPSVATVSSSWGSSVTITGVANGMALITARLATQTGSFEATCSVSVGTGFGAGSIYGVGAQATVPLGTTNFTLASTNTDTTSSVADQILRSVYSYSNGRTLSHIIFSNVTSSYGSLSATVGVPYYYTSGMFNTIGAITFTPSAFYTGAATFPFTAYDSMGGTYSGTLNINVGTTAAAADIRYSLTAGQSKALVAADFTSFFTTATSGTGTLSYVTFGTPTGSVGSLKYYISNAYGFQSYQATVSAGTPFYVTPSVGQYGINAVSFEPTTTSAGYTGTLTVPFTATGYSYAAGSSFAGTITKQGNLVINVTNGNISTITYQPRGNSIALNPVDFVNAYKQAVSSSVTAPIIYIRFTDVPDFGTLSYRNNYTSTNTVLNKANIGNQYFSSQTSSSACIDDVYYTPAATGASDVITYEAYNSFGGSLLYTGTVTFTSGSAPAVVYYGTSATPITFSSSAFSAYAPSSATSFVTLGVPSTGTLYKNYSNGTGDKVVTSTTFTLGATNAGSLSTINSVAFVPGSSLPHAVEIPFTISGVAGTQASGTIKVYIAKTFTDVSSTHWAYKHIAQLTAQGIIGGATATTYAPNGTLKYGEALKMIMLAAGYSEQVKTGNHWASGYLARAYRDGLVDSLSVNLDRNIDRNTIAAITAKALGLGKDSTIDTGVTAPSDSTDGYVYALYNAGIVGGTTTGGRNYFYGANAITRAEIAKIICNVSDYAGK